MLTSRMNWSSGSAIHWSETGAEDAPRAPAEASAISESAVRAHALTRAMPVPSGPPALTQNGLGFGDRDGAGVAGLDEIDRHRPRSGGSELVADWNHQVAGADLGIDGDPALDGDRILDPRLEHPDVAEHRSVAGAIEVERHGRLAIMLGERDVRDSELRLEIAHS